MRSEDGEERLYTPRERDEIVCLAARIQAANEDACALGDIEEAALQAGIQPRHVREAAAALRPGPRRRIAARPLGRPTPTMRWDFAAMLLLPALLLLPSFWHTAPVSPAYEGLPLLAAMHAFRLGRTGVVPWAAPLLFLLGGALAVALATVVPVWHNPLPMYLFARPLPLVVFGPAAALIGWGASRLPRSARRSHSACRA